MRGITKMIEIAATHKIMDVRTTLKAESLEECERLNSKYWKDFEPIGSAETFHQRFRKKHPTCDWDNAEIDKHYE